MVKYKLLLIIGLLIIGIIIIFLFVPFNFDVSFGKPEEVSFKTIDKGIISQVIERKNILINSSKELQSLDINYAGNFSEKIVLAAFQGEQQTSGYEIIIYNVTQTRNNIQVHVKESIPVNCIVEDTITAPYHIIEIDKTKRNKEIIFVVEEVLECKNVD